MSRSLLTNDCKEQNFDVAFLAAETDLEAISQLDASAFEFPWSFADFEGSLKAGHQFLLLKDDDRLLGFAVYMQIFEQSELLTIAVTPSEQGMGTVN